MRTRNMLLVLHKMLLVSLQGVLHMLLLMRVRVGLCMRLRLLVLLLVLLRMCWVFCVHDTATTYMSMPKTASSNTYTCM